MATSNTSTAFSRGTTGSGGGGKHPERARGYQKVQLANTQIVLILTTLSASFEVCSMPYKQALRPKGGRIRERLGGNATANANANAADGHRSL